MTTTQFEYPALYRTANVMSASSQSFFLWLVKAEYGLLLLATISSMNFYTTSLYFIIPALILIALLVLMITRSLLKPEQGWYRGRALAESIKTSSWKYCMRGEPFGDADNLAMRRSEFRTYLAEILSANRLIGDRMPPDQAAADQITTSMEDVRALPLEDRIRFYDTHRILEQRKWYAKKAGANKKASRLWVVASVIAYAVAIVLSLMRITQPTFVFWPIEPVIVVASSILGWMQVKKFNELASSYTLTAHEIGIIRGKIPEMKTEGDFSQFVVEAEQAFSREHTQWVARQQHA
ncbi:DUF4231 domain-containing protein (plasmid) [Rhizobium sophoriradicis]|uniref:DUF4231 domain-containing protein n=1 Tax=Rhizobium sophoriradicis TaxID=1535245 RepID=UPI0016125B18|nr:DUF4231 domain-containing protein [Rhizobium leguminosarum bv. phaseoli]